jgi:hypothetical protein
LRARVLAAVEFARIEAARVKALARRRAQFLDTRIGHPRVGLQARVRVRVGLLALILALVLALVGATVAVGLGQRRIAGYDGQRAHRGAHTHHARQPAAAHGGEDCTGWV